MEIKLIKLDKDKYTLIYKENNIMSEHVPVFDGKLSLKNCQAIENGYDLDELAESEYPLYGELEDLNEENRNAFIEGFQKALEILGDKKFSEEDMKYFAGFAIGYTKNGIQSDTENVLDDKLKSLQQTEWEVEIVMEQYVKYVPKSLATVYPTGGVRPKLDKDGCLILKRK